MVFIPEEKLPDFFKNESRRNVLYAPLRSKTVNPNDWNFKITSWKQLLNLYCSSNKVYYFSLESLNVAFQDNGRTPSCLEEVIRNMLENKEIEPCLIFTEKKTKSWAEWAKKSFITSPLTWSLKTMKDLIITPDNNKIEYVPLHVVHIEADTLLQELLNNNKNEVLSLNELMKENIHDVKDKRNFEILLASLYNRNKIDIKEIGGNSVDPENLLVKICDPNHFEPITDVDLGIRTLKANEKAIEKNIEVLTKNADKYKEEAKAYLVKGQKQLAKASLKKKHEIENRINKKSETLFNIHILWNKLQDVTLGKEVWNSYKKAVEVFEETLKKGADTDAVDDTMIKVAEMLEIQSDMENALGKPVLDEGDDLEKELEELLENDEFNKGNKGSPSKESDESLMKAMENLELNLPSVPSSPVRDFSQNISTQMN